MIKVLILAYDFPPYVSVAGLRPYSWYRYFKEFELYPVVVTRQWDNSFGNKLDYVSASKSADIEIEVTEFGTLIKAPYKPNISNRLLLKYGESRFKRIRKMITAFFEFWQFLFFIGPKSSLYFAANDYLHKNDVGIIIATGEPYILFRYASTLGKKHKTPWIADYRDPWSQDKNISNNWMTKKFNSFFEEKYSKKAVAITTVSDFFKNKIGHLICQMPIHIVCNGFDPEAIEKIKKRSPDRNGLSIAYVGSICLWHPLDSFFRVCSDFIKGNNINDFQVNFYGVNYKYEIPGMLQSSYPNLIPVVKIHPGIPNEQLLAELTKEDLLILFNNYSITGAKIYEYMALNRMIILCYSNDPEAKNLKEKYFIWETFESENNHLMQDLIIETNSGVIAKDEYHLGKLLKDFYIEKNERGFVSCNSINTQKFSRRIQAGKLAQIIRDIVEE